MDTADRLLGSPKNHKNNENPTYGIFSGANVMSIVIYTSVLYKNCITLMWRNKAA